MKVVNFNINGIRSAAKKGLFTWLATLDADFICLQEVRANIEQVADFRLKNYKAYYALAQKPGYSGVAIFTKHEPTAVVNSIGWPLADNEGRYLQLDFNKLKIISLYLPSGTSGPERQDLKYDFMNKYLSCITPFLELPCIMAGDWNIAHKRIDLKNWRANQNSTGFLPEERAWLDRLFSLGWVDAFRTLHPDKEAYTWWSNFGKAWERNVGWRIDYQIISPQLRPHISYAQIYREQKFSDHAPLIIDYKYSF